MAHAAAEIDPLSQLNNRLLRRVGAWRARMDANPEETRFRQATAGPE